ncbi:L-alanine-DL-glutamate epimerase [Thermomonospora echinospora]|uniref:L-alanine-DL-glutamate epimerase n=1 Tax=Thermomonospora echinospora TaxID=1992 RepID=A0A1H6DI59_9ACTN|nr:enolase C-terminal domain-like protein [Thermomonospora echinospora]SEG84882.1 L-alanine-DL-glutamate epimerase [Thermomonospora echinospora]
MAGARAIPLESIKVSAYRVPTAEPESDATLEWDATTIVVVQMTAAGHTGLGYTYGPAAVAALVHRELRDVLSGADASNVTALWAAMTRALRNAGRPGIGAMAISAVDIALWDLKARILDVPLVVALDACHRAVPIYGSGGFTSYTDRQLADQLSGWAEQGIGRVKMKIGRDPAADRARVTAARSAIGDDIELMVDANGGYRRKQALAWARWFGGMGVTWLEEPVSSDDLAGLRLLRDTGPPGMDIAAGEYGDALPYFRRMLEAGAVDCLQADVTRCGGITGFLRAGALCDAHGLDLSAHCAPQAALHACTAVWHLRHLEYFHDHVRIERMLFDGVREPTATGTLEPDLTRPGLGLELKEADAEPYLETAR